MTYEELALNQIIETNIESNVRGERVKGKIIYLNPEADLIYFLIRPIDGGLAYKNLENVRNCGIFSSAKFQKNIGNYLSVTQLLQYRLWKSGIYVVTKVLSDLEL